MKIKSNLNFNTSIMASHSSGADGEGNVVVGGGQPKRLKIPAGATITLSDEEWPNFDTEATRGSIACGNFTLIESPVMSAEEQAKYDDELEASLREQMAGIRARRAAAEEAAELAAQEASKGSDDSKVEE